VRARTPRWRAARGAVSTALRDTQAHGARAGEGAEQARRRARANKHSRRFVAHASFY
jgi:hypothetical protein